MIALIDYGAGNLFSVKNALDYLNADVKVTKTVEDIEKASGIILPGVGAFKQSMDNLRKSGLVDVIMSEAKKKPFLGICLGMQMLFEESHEFEVAKGLGLLEGTVSKIDSQGLKIPHMGWNNLTKNKDCPLIEGIPDNSFVYFVHSYKANALNEDVVYYSQYGEPIPALVSKGNIFGAQFHPEKSSDVGLKMLENFIKLCEI